jgi:hypothetical protein
MYFFHDNSHATNLLRHMQKGEYVKAIHSLNSLLTPIYMYRLLINGKRIQEMCRCAIHSALYAAGMTVTPSYGISGGVTDMSTTHDRMRETLVLRTKIIDGMTGETPKLHGVDEEMYTKSIEHALRDGMTQIVRTNAMYVERKTPIAVTLVVDARGRFISSRRKETRTQ